MSGKFVACVHVLVVLWYKVHIMEDKAIEIPVAPRLDKTGIHEPALVERLVARLKEKDIYVMTCYEELYSSFKFIHIISCIKRIQTPV